MIWIYILSHHLHDVEKARFIFSLFRFAHKGKFPYEKIMMTQVTIFSVKYRNFQTCGLLILSVWIKCNISLVNFLIACVAGGIRERASARRRIRHKAREGFRERRSREWTGLLTNPLTASPLSFTASLPKQKLSRAKSRQLRRLIFWRII